MEVSAFFGHLQGVFSKEKYDNGYLFIKCVVKLSHYRPGQPLEGSRRFRLPNFKTFDT
jgi:hypothetical protein